MNRFIEKDGDGLRITDEGYQLLQEIVTDTHGDVYAITHAMPPTIAAATMARLSRRGDDFRKIFLDEFAENQENADGLIQRVVTAYGDESVQQLLGIHIVVENASNILTKLLEWGRFGAYLEQSTRYIYFDKKDAEGKYRYYEPCNLPDHLKKKYRITMNGIFSRYSHIVRALTEYVRRKSLEPKDPSERTAWLGATRGQACDGGRPLLPAATRSTVGIFASTQAIENLVMHLFSETLPEAQEIGRSILREARKVCPVFLERADKKDRGLATALYRQTTRAGMRELTRALLNDHHEGGPEENSPVTLLDFFPVDELDLVTEMLFEYSTLSVSTIRERVKRMSQEEKKRIFCAYIGKRLNRRHKPGRVIEKAHYEWEITGDYGTFRDLQRHRVVDAFEWQRLSPYLGYDVPALVQEANLEVEFRRCFELSMNLFENMTKSGLEEEAQYATLLGHRMRYRFVVNARAAFHIHELRTAPGGHPGYRKIVGSMHDLLSRVHPMMAEAMCFVNRAEDPALTRLASELVTQSKLAMLGVAPDLTE